ncbi:hypothetical protein BD626DRAFT_557770 [Schizophyllum amplum]|uniref:SGNH hydrolase-type esterase domain-containing protein n=1 Tax=Schizophyllum amplum TaxID=97359 RepID=A0A550CDF6_9AGAR|nr:hypothetical protein BD626DRAFT_557770 [Auriculariopsis ampla]
MSATASQDAASPMISTQEAGQTLDPGPLRSGTLKTLVVFGDSFSATARRDLDAVYSAEEMTWVDFLKSHPDLRTPVIRNFAYPYATAKVDLGEQMAKFFTVYPPGSREKILEPTTTTYVFYFGINDCDVTLAEDVAPLVDKVLDAARTLRREVGATDFVIMDIPPLERSPEATGRTPENATQVIAAMDAWNKVLRVKVANFAQEAAGRTIRVFSPHAVFTAILDHPEEYGFTMEDTTKIGGAIWADEVHATPAVHKIVAARLVA